MSEPVRKTLLLHCCCAPCTTHPLQLLRDAYVVTAFFYNPNIHPAAEYRKREDEIGRFARRWDFPLVTGPYEDAAWFRRMAGTEDTPEGGERCERCYRMRLDRTARLAAERGFDLFGTTLSISPHKKADTINGIGRDLADSYGVAFFKADFKKRDGFKIGCRISREEGLYRQDYCGCVYSRGEVR
jgi:predicted adenine nucleotide alpha hydrolase (AANH) superfamily ATPase